MEDHNCCGQEMLHFDADYYNGCIADMWICPICFSYTRIESGDLDAEDAFNYLGINPEDIQNFESLSEEELTIEFQKAYAER